MSAKAKPLDFQAAPIHEFHPVGVLVFPAELLEAIAEALNEIFS